MKKISKTRCIKKNCLTCDHYYFSIEYSDGEWHFGEYYDGEGYEFFYCDARRLLPDEENCGEIKDNCKYYIHRKATRLKDNNYVIRGNQKIPYKDL